MRKVIGFECVHCGREHKVKETRYTCLACGGNLQVIYDYNIIKKRLTYKSLEGNPDKSIWRYLDILPVEDHDNIPPVHVGWTPLYKAENLGKELGLNSLYIKDDGRNPTCSFKDRASAVVVARALELRQKVITGASTGNAAASLSCLTGSLNVKTVIFVPKTAPEPKVAQLLVFGATVIMVDGTYDEAFDLCVKASDKYGWYNRNTGYNPYTREGKKTCAFEICEQLDWEAPHKVFVSVGDGNIISGLWKGFQDFQRLGIVEKLPQMIAVQAEHSNAVKLAVEGDGEIRPVSGKTLADSISVSLPRDGEAAVQAVRNSEGFAVSVTDDEIVRAIPEVARGANVFAEPAAAAAFAGLKKAAAAGQLKEDETVVVVITGNGLKDVKNAMKSVGGPYHIKPDAESLGKLLSEHEGLVATEEE